MINVPVGVAQSRPLVGGAARDRGTAPAPVAASIRV
jgi:hypothetical protein